VAFAIARTPSADDDDLHNLDRSCLMKTAEHLRLDEERAKGVGWRKWGPYVSDRQWGTVREDYSATGNAWDSFSHDQARSRAYRWGEDGLAGISDDKQRLCFALALWNGRDPILKERLFGLTNGEGNHGEDVKEQYYYLDCTPTHSYMKYLYKYPQSAYPYDELVQTNRRRGPRDREYELLDTKAFDDNRYFDVFVEYAKQSPGDILILITVHNRGPEAAPLHVLPTLWFRNTWSWSPGQSKPMLRATPAGSGIVATQADLGEMVLHCEGKPALLFTENETNMMRIAAQRNAGEFVKDGINDYIVHGRKGSINPAQSGTKAAADYMLTVPAGGSAEVRLRLSGPAKGAVAGRLGSAFAAIFARRRREADEFYRSITPASLKPDEAGVMRQALAGMLWSKQFFHYDVDNWLAEHGCRPLEGAHRPVRNAEWFHMYNRDIISMPDKWEYPWYAAWDLAFHTASLALVDLDFAKDQLEMMLGEAYLHPNGQMPAYEWNFSDVNPPVHAFATLTVYEQERVARGRGDVAFLKRAFAKLLLNFTWWVNRKDREGRNVFEGGFLGLDNIGVFDRSSPLPTGGYLEQADGTAWMAVFCQNMLAIAIELATHDPTYTGMAVKFVEHLLWIAAAINRMSAGGEGLWDEQDGFYYDVLRLPDGSGRRLKVRSMVGLLPLAATTVVEPWVHDKLPELIKRVEARIKRMPQLVGFIHPTGKGHLGVNNRGILALVGPDKLRRMLTRMLDESEFLSPYGIRSLSRHHASHPYVMHVDGREYRVPYLPAESDNNLFGGNSNWRGPIWFPVNIVLIRALRQYHLYYGDSFRIECPTGSGRLMNLFEVSQEIGRRMASIFLRDPAGRRPVFGDNERLQTDPHWRDAILFHEYFDGDTGRGLGASHQTGWTGLVANVLVQRLGAAPDPSRRRPRAKTAARPKAGRKSAKR
jgi:hypothetical protein